ncbi:MAG: hypothetical protein JWR18_2269, partial [Segetibacter sp.]|nr:hypothetical protein [Segetibacter sp.]
GLSLTCVVVLQNTNQSRYPGSDWVSRFLAGQVVTTDASETPERQQEV